MQRDGGPAGGGNPTGGSFTGPAQALEIIGDHAYAFSGRVDCDDTATDLLTFTSGNYYLVGQIQFFYSSDTIQSDDFRYRVAMNDSIILQYNVSTGRAEDWASALNIIIPPYTKIVCDATNIQSADPREQACGITGRIYRG